MDNLSSGTLIGMCVGFAWGLGCSIALLYSLYLAGYQKAIEDSVKPDKPQRFAETLARVQTRNV